MRHEARGTRDARAMAADALDEICEADEGEGWSEQRDGRFAEGKRAARPNTSAKTLQISPKNTNINY
jgi:hypothetical protein